MHKWVGGEETKPGWDDYYMTICYVVAQRSVDKNTVCGACLVSEDHRLLSIGYNGPLSGGDFEESNLTNRPEKYFYMIYAEENCIINYHGSHSDLIGATMYVTGPPCHRCFRMILQKGIRKIVHGFNHAQCVNEDDAIAKEKMLNSLSDPVAIGEKFYDEDGNFLGRRNGPQVINLGSALAKRSVKLLNKTLNYIEYKENSNG